MSEVVERYSFQIQPEISDEEFIRAGEELGEWAKRQAGMQFRALSKSEDGYWHDVMYFASKEAAEAADADFGNSMMGTKYQLAIVMESFSRNSGVVHQKTRG